MIQGRWGFRGGFTEERIQLGASLARRDPLFPPLVILLGKEESGEIDDLSAFALRQRFTEAHQFLGVSAHGAILAGTNHRFQPGNAERWRAMAIAVLSTPPPRVRSEADVDPPPPLRPRTSPRETCLPAGRSHFLSLH